MPMVGWKPTVPPGYVITHRLRYLALYPFWKLRFKHFGAHSFIDPGVTILKPGHLSVGRHARIFHRCFIANLEGEVQIGDYSHLGVDVYINATRGLVRIGNHVAIAPKTHIYSYSNHYEPGKLVVECYKIADVVIEDDVGIGAGVVIVPGIIIHTGAFIGAGSVVTRDVAAYTIVAGVPARPLKKRLR